MHIGFNFYIRSFQEKWMHSKHKKILVWPSIANGNMLWQLGICMHKLRCIELISTKSTITNLSRCRMPLFIHTVGAYN